MPPGRGGRRLRDIKALALLRLELSARERRALLPRGGKTTLPAGSHDLLYLYTIHQYVENTPSGHFVVRESSD